MSNIFELLHSLIIETEITKKCNGVKALFDTLDKQNDTYANADNIKKIISAGLPKTVQLVAPRQVKRRGIQSQEGRNHLMHSIAHIEFNAINLALDAAYRFRNQPAEFYQDWISIANDEARHFCLIQDYLKQNGCEYGDHPCHNGLWEMAVKTDHDIVARMALVPRVLEARGLDVTPKMIERLESVGDKAAVDILKIIYQDEITHVEKGSHWFFYQCQQHNLEPRKTFIKMVETHLHGELKGPFNISARLQAGFDEDEMAYLSKRY